MVKIKAAVLSVIVIQDCLGENNYISSVAESNEIIKWCQLSILSLTVATPFMFIIASRCFVLDFIVTIILILVCSIYA